MIGEMNAVPQIPSSVYVIIGGLILANLGTVVTVIYGIGKLVWFIAKLDSRVGALEHDTTRDIDAAHAAIRDIRSEISQTHTI